MPAPLAKRVDRQAAHGGVAGLEVQSIVALKLLPSNSIKIVAFSPLVKVLGLAPGWG